MDSAYFCNGQCLLLQWVLGFTSAKKCLQVIKLSDAVQSLPRETTCFCHGVPDAFLQVGMKMNPGGGGGAKEAGEGASKPRLDLSGPLRDLDPVPDEDGAAAGGGGRDTAVGVTVGTQGGAHMDGVPGNGWLNPSLMEANQGPLR